MSILAVGFAIIARAGLTYHFAHGIIFTIGAIIFQSLINGFGYTIFVSVLTAMIFSILVGVSIDTWVYEPLRKRKTSVTAMLITSMGVYIVVQNLLSIVFGDGSQSVQLWDTIFSFSVGGARLAIMQVAILISSVVTLAVVLIWTKRSICAKAITALRNDIDLAECVGINVRRTRFMAICIGSALASVSGILTVCDTASFPTMGFLPLFSAMVAAIIGRWSVEGTIIVSLMMGLIQHVAVLWVPTLWQDPIMFFLLVLFLISKPEGILDIYRGKVIA